jgi:hypothetical protein
MNGFAIVSLKQSMNSRIFRFKSCFDVKFPRLMAFFAKMQMHLGGQVLKLEYLQYSRPDLQEHWIPPVCASPTTLSNRRACATPGRPSTKPNWKCHEEISTKGYPSDNLSTESR